MPQHVLLIHGRTGVVAAAVLALGLVVFSGCTAPDGLLAPRPMASAPARPTEAPALVVPADGGAREQAQGTTGSEVAKMIYFTPAPGDTLTGIAARFGVCVPDLVAANGGNREILAGEEIVVARTTATPLDDRACLG